MTTHRVLVVDDDADQLDLLEVFLTSKGFVVETAINGVEGLRLCEERRPALVITDNTMPEMTGLELIHAIRNHVGLSATKIVMVSGDWGEIKTQATAAGVDRFLSKPYNLNDLLGVVTSLLR